MDFVQMVSAYIGRPAEIAVPNLIVTGTLVAVTAVDIQIQEAPTIYTPTPVLATVPIRNIDYVRVIP